ncbi:MAG: preprotein translocase subunit SecG [Planctomycetota bacterium]
MFITGLLWFVFIASALLLGLIILIQEGKGGGLGEAFGGMGAETFGVKASGVNRVTGIIAAIFVVSSIMINKCSMESTSFFDDTPSSEAPAGPGGAGGGAPPDAPQGG